MTVARPSKSSATVGRFIPLLFSLALATGVAIATGPSAAGSAASVANARSKSYTVRVTVDAVGRVTLAEPLGEVPDAVRGMIVRAAMHARFEPARRTGQAVPSRTHLKVAVTFKPEAGDASAQVTGLSPGGGWQRNGAMPRYPAHALVNGYGAQVWARAVFRTDGTVDLGASGIEGVRIRSDSQGRLEGQEALRQEFSVAVLALVAKWSYLPDLVDGQPVAVLIHVPTRFCAPSRVSSCDTDYRRDGDPRPFVPASLDTTVRLATLKSDSTPRS